MSESANLYPWHHWQQQSPIDLAKEDSLPVKFPKSFLSFDYRDAPFSGQFKGEDGHKNFVLDKPHSGKLPPMLMLGDVQAELVKIHLHTKSEHNLEGQDLDGEIHLIHEIKSPTSGSQFVVIGVFFNESNKDSLVKTEFFSMWAGKVGRNRSTKIDEESVLIDPRKLLPKIDRWYRYEGSLTTEPYSEIVSWLVFVDPLGVTSEDLTKLKKKAHQPERPVQPLNRRFLIRNF